jgi:Protein of unknown function (DUF3106).
MEVAMKKISRRHFLALVLGSGAATTARLGWARADSTDALEKWRQLSPEKREQLRARWKVFKGMSPEKRRKLKAAFERWRAMDPERRQRLRENFRRWRQMSPDRRRK